MCVCTPLHLIKQTVRRGSETAAAAAAGGENDVIECGRGRFAHSPGTDDVTAHLHKHHLLLHLMSRENTSTGRRRWGSRD